ncbi:MAG: Trm112 family protein [Actinomycetia bacterium]|nr:Trm112 family protein [Actinomycetes bacterium]
MTILDSKLLDILVCPVCRSSLAVDESASTLVCNACPRTFDVRDGVPVMTVDASAKGPDVRRHTT